MHYLVLREGLYTFFWIYLYAIFVILVFRPLPGSGVNHQHSQYCSWGCMKLEYIRPEIKLKINYYKSINQRTDSKCADKGECGYVRVVYLEIPVIFLAYWRLRVVYLEVRVIYLAHFGSAWSRKITRTSRSDTTPSCPQATVVNAFNLDLRGYQNDKL